MVHAFFRRTTCIPIPSVPGAEMVERVRELAERHVEPQMVRGGNAPSQAGEEPTGQM